MPSKMMDIVDAIDECEKHQCQTITVNRCRDCPSFYGYYESIAGKKTLLCIYPKEHTLVPSM